MNTYKVYLGKHWDKKKEIPFTVNADKWEVKEQNFTDYSNTSYVFYTGEDVVAFFPNVEAIIKVDTALV